MSNRTLGCNVLIYDAKNHDTVLGGLILTNGMTNNNFYAMVAYFLCDESGATIQRGDHPLQQGKYFIVTAAPFSVNNEPWLVRSITVTTGTHVEELIDALHQQRHSCIVTGDCHGFEAAHIFPLAYAGHPDDHRYGSWITIPPENGGSINSTQEGILLKLTCIFLLTATMCRLTQMYDNYKIVYFRSDGNDIAGTHLDKQFHEHPSRPHFSQAVLVYVRRKGEPASECNFAPCSDMIGEIMNGLKAG
ncbi:hypothetical protein L873DRAFT_1839411 [Choiromyces venosus 120613-1]|uniref:Uncharacterized protein n=1 Tax=Choiromyces venosus 120613-1 TaxID=1336337 RepID=A0A3N4IR75_9PEZI|nr:hypothetical protein L873DRAFT_1839411 [Choiromyces venosus 120613-1]